MLKTGILPIPQEIEQIGYRTIGCAITVHRLLGPGFKEKIYHEALCLELNEAGLKFECETAISVPYKKWEIPGQRVDMIVERVLLVEVKAIPRLRPLHHRQTVSYLKATHLRLALLINFNVTILRQGLRRIVL